MLNTISCPVTILCPHCCKYIDIHNPYETKCPNCYEDISDDELFDAFFKEGYLNDDDDGERCLSDDDYEELFGGYEDE